MQQGWLTKTFKGDRAIWGLVALFIFYSLLAVYSSSVGVAFMKHGGNTTYFLKSQLITLIFSLGLIVIVHYLPYRIYFSMAGLILIGSVGLLVLTFVIGSRVNEAMRSIPIPGLGRLQTSDVAKVALVLYLARSLAKYQKDLNNFLLVTKYFIVPVGIVCALIMPENLSTAVLVFGMSMIIMFIGRIPVKFIMAYIGIGVAGVLLFAMLLTVIKKDNNRVQVWKNRIEHFFSSKGDEDGDYQSNQAKIAISTGGLFGKAPGRSTQRNMLPQSNSDFIFAIIIEEYGLLFGAIPLILAYMILLFRGITIAKKCETASPAFLVLGLIVMIVFQAMINMMVAVGLFPVTGQTLPMVSWGRTSVLVMSFSIGAILSVSRVVNARIKKEELPEEEISDEGEKIYVPAKT
jgi:cell division protein FtsW